MTHTRTFRGHEGVVPPLGLRASVAAPPAPVDLVEDELVDLEVTELTTDDTSLAVVETIPDTEGDEPVELVTEAIELPTNRDKVKVIDAFIAEQREQGAVIDVADDATKPEKLAAIEAWAETIPALSNTDTEE